MAAHADSESTLPAASSDAPRPSERSLTLDVAPRRPRLAWQGMHRKEVAVSVPTQVVPTKGPISSA